MMHSSSWVRYHASSYNLKCHKILEDVSGKNIPIVICLVIPSFLTSFSLLAKRKREERYSKLATYWTWIWQTALLLRGGWKYQLTVSDSEMKFWYILDHFRGRDGKCEGKEKKNQGKRLFWFLHWHGYLCGKIKERSDHL